MDGVEGESEDANVGWATGDGDDESDLEVGMDVEDDGLNVDDLIESDDAEEEGMDEEDAAEVAAAILPAPAPVARAASSKKRAAPGGATSATPAVVSVAPPSKKAKSVKFAEKALGKTGTGSTTATAASTNVKQVTADLDGDVGLNKSIKQNAKKDKKKAAKKAAEKKAEVKSVEKEFGSDADMPAKPRGARVVKSMDVDEAYSFEEFFGPKKGKKVEQEQENDDEEL